MRHSPGSGGSTSRTRRRWRTCSARCWCWRRGRGWGSSAISRWTGRRSPRARRRTPSRTEPKLRSWPGRSGRGGAAADAAEDEPSPGMPAGTSCRWSWLTRRLAGERIRRALAELEAERKAAEAERDARARRLPGGAGVRAGGQPAAGGGGGGGGPGPGGPRRGGPAGQARRVGAPARRGGRGPGPPPARRPQAVPARGARRGGQGPAALERAEAEAAEAGRKAAAKTGPGPVRNITDPDSRLMPVRGGGFIQGYNAQAVHSADGLCLGTMLTQDTTDYASFEPMMRHAQAARDLLRAHARGPLHRRRAKIAALSPGRRRVPLRSQPHRGRPGPADRHRQAPRPGTLRPPGRARAARRRTGPPRP